MSEGRTDVRIRLFVPEYRLLSLTYCGCRYIFVLYNGYNSSYCVHKAPLFSEHPILPVVFIMMVLLLELLALLRYQSIGCFLSINTSSLIFFSQWFSVSSFCSNLLHSLLYTNLMQSPAPLCFFLCVCLDSFHVLFVSLCCAML
jgi:hypothetical protein